MSSKKNKIIIINGPNINMLGTREPEIYGSATLADLDEMCRSEGQKYGVEVDCFQSNIEGDIVTKIQNAKDVYQAIVINAGAYTHTSVAIMDALLAVDLPVIEVHISNILKREDFRHQSYISAAAIGMISGLGINGYSYAIQDLAHQL